MNLSRKALHRPSILYQAAVLPWRLGDGARAGHEIMLITSLGTGRWVLPKGTLMPGESARMAAKREAHEEAGLDGVLMLRPLGSYYYEKRISARGAGTQLCSVEVYPLKVTALREYWPERGLRRSEWFAPDLAAAAVKEEELRDLILGFEPTRRIVGPARQRG